MLNQLNRLTVYLESGTCASTTHRENNSFNDCRQIIDRSKLKSGVTTTVESFIFQLNMHFLYQNKKKKTFDFAAWISNQR